MKGGKIRMYCTYGNCSANEGYEMRRFLTKEEKIEMLKEYKNYLDKESEGVTERIAELNKED